jgi:hypothetical protein
MAGLLVAVARPIGPMTSTQLEREHREQKNPLADPHAVDYLL